VIVTLPAALPRERAEEAKRKGSFVSGDRSLVLRVVHSGRGRERHTKHNNKERERRRGGARARAREAGLSGLKVCVDLQLLLHAMGEGIRRQAVPITAVIGGRGTKGLMRREAMSGRAWRNRFFFEVH
jgi:hypothetical protein